MPRAGKINGFQGELKSSFLSCPKDTQILLQKLFVQSRPFSDRLKKLLIINKMFMLK